MKDRYGRDVTYLRLSLTDKCNLRCRYCMPASGLVNKLTHDEVLRKDEILRIVRVAAQLGITGVRITGGEPLVRKNVLGVVDGVAHTPGIQDVSLTTNGILLPKFARELKDAGLSRINISLDSLDPGQYRNVTRCGNLEDALAGIVAALEAGLHPVKINAVAIRSLEQDFLSFACMSIDKPLHVRFIEYMPVGASAGMNDCGWGMADVVSCDEILDTIIAAAREQGLPGLEPVESASRPQGNGPARYFQFPGAEGTVGFISPLSRHFCGECNRLRLTSDGKLRPCLFSDREYDVRAAVRGGTDDDVADVFEAAVAGKPDAHNGKVGTERGMSQIGG